MPIKLSRFVGVRFKPDDYQRLDKVAQGLGIKVSKLIRNAALDKLNSDAALGVHPAPRRRRLADQKLINQLSRLGNNLNQQTRLLHQLHHRRLPPETASVLAVLRDVRDLLKQVSRRVAEAAR